MPRAGLQPETLRTFGATLPGVWKQYRALREACDRSGPLPRKTRELIKVGIEAALKRRGGLIAHIDRALSAGATKAEIYHVLALVTPLAGLPTTLDAFVVAEQRFG